ncbi:MAG: hypothetical protein ACXIVL_07575 [Oceanicaulis sp.]
MAYIEGVLYEVPADQRYWVIRSDGGAFSSHFRLHNVVAIGHLDDHRFSDEQISFPPEEFELSELVTNSLRRKDYSVAQISASFNQIRKFIYEVSIGDLVVTVDDLRVSIGRIASDPYFERERLFAKDGDQIDLQPMDMYCRRKVVWGPSVLRAELPAAFTRSLRANQTIFNIDKHVAALHHILYDCFVLDGRLHSTLRVDSREKVLASDISRVLDALISAEMIAKSQDEFTPDSIRRSSMAGDSEIAAQLEIMSPGEIWTVLSQFGDIKQYLTFYFAYSAFFGSKVLGWDGIIDKDLKNQIIQYVNTNWINAGFEQVRARMKLKARKRNTSNIENKPKKE